MEYWQRRYIHERESLPSRTGLLTIDLPNKGLLGCVELSFTAMGGTDTGKPDVWIHDCLEKIELIVNGSQVVKSLTGEQVLAHNMYDGSIVSPIGPRNYNNTELHEHFLLNLGRYFHDLDYMLDLGRVNDPEVRVHYQFNKTSQNGWDQGQAFKADPLPYFYCIPHLLRQSDVVPKGYIKTSEVYRFTSAASRNENMTIPRGPMYCGLYLQSRYNGEGLGLNLDHIEVNINNGELIPFRLAERDFFNEVKRRYGTFLVSMIIKCADNNHPPAPLENCEILESSYAAQDIIGCHGPAWGGYNTIEGRSISAYTNDVTDRMRWFHFLGILPYNVAKIPYLDAKEERFWIDSSELGDFWVRVEETVGAGTNAVIKLLADEVVTTYM